jgi:hypothetical protein
LGSDASGVERSGSGAPASDIDIVPVDSLKAF